MGFSLERGATPPLMPRGKDGHGLPRFYAQKRRFLPLCPDFVVELRSSSDHPATYSQISEYLDNDAR